MATKSKSLQYTQTLLRKFTIVNGIDSQWDFDLIDMSALAKKNDGVKYLLLVIDIFSKYIFVHPLKNKTVSEVVKAFKSIFAEGRRPKLAPSDKGSEFKGHLLKLFKDLGIYHFVTQNEGKANYAERCIRTLKASKSHSKRKVYRKITRSSF